jgi:hypothetical protein
MQLYQTGTLRRLFSIYRVPGIVLTLLAIPGINNLLWFNPHGFPIVGLVLVNSVPLCTPYVVCCLIRLNLQARKRYNSGATHDSPSQQNMSLLKQSLLSFAVYPIMLVPLSWMTATQPQLDIKQGVSEMELSPAVR